MLRSLFTGISGVRSHQVYMDVTANNIANVNTAGFKTSQTQFVDTISQMLQGASTPQPSNDPASGIGDDALLGGTNPAQVGLGVRLAGVTTNFQQGSTQLTGRATDLMLNGDGFFVVNFSSKEGGEAETFYTRSGQFSFDANRELVAPNGAKVIGYQDVDTSNTAFDIAPPPAAAGGAPGPRVEGTIHLPRYIYKATGHSDADPKYALADLNDAGNPTVFNPTGDADAPTIPAGTEPDGELSTFEIGPDGTVTAVYDNGEKRSVAQVAVASFANPQGLTKTGNSMYRPTQNSGDAELDVPGVGPRGRLTSGTLEMSNVDLATEFTNMILAQRGLQANSRTITTSDDILQELVNLKR